jgi:membrane protein required for colicin V production
MNYLDIIILIPLLWGGYRGFTKGLIIEIASLAALLLGIWGGIRFSSFVSGFLAGQFGMTTQYLPVIAFAVTFIGIVILVHLVARLTDKIVKAAALGIVNRILGAAFGAAKFFLIIGVVITLLNKADKENKILSDEMKQKSLLYQPACNLVMKIYPAFEEVSPKVRQELPALTEEKN